MGKTQSFNEYAMIQSAILETRRKIEARNDSIERQRELLLAQEDTLKRQKMMEQIESEKKSIERDKKLLKSLEEKAEKTAMKGNLSDEDRHKAQNLANKGNEKASEKNAAEKNETMKAKTGEAGKTQTGSSKAKDDVNKNRKTNDDAEKGKGNPENEDRKANSGEKEGKGTSEKEKGELEEKIRDAKRTSPEKEGNKSRKENNGEKERNGTPSKFPKKNKRDLSLEIADARERLHIAEDHFKNSLNTQSQNAFVRNRKEE